LRADRQFDRTVIIGASATASDSDHKNVFFSVCDDFVVKPIRIDLLLEKIGAQLGLEWETREIVVAPRQTYAALDDRELSPPPPAELDELLDLAMRGDMLGVERWATGLEARDTRYHNFAGKLKELAGSFRTKAVLALVKQCRGEEI